MVVTEDQAADSRPQAAVTRLGKASQGKAMTGGHQTATQPVVAEERIKREGLVPGLLVVMAATVSTCQIYSVTTAMTAGLGAVVPEAEAGHPGRVDAVEAVMPFQHLAQKAATHNQERAVVEQRAVQMATAETELGEQY